MLKFVVIALILALVIFIVHKTNTNKKLALESQSKGREFLQQNASNEGVKTSDSGLQYLQLAEGTGSDKPKPNSRVKVHYHGTLIDGTVFDSSVARGQPIEFGLHQVIPGWTEGLQLMVKGEKMRFFIPPELGYGNRAAGAIPPGSVLIFDVELLDFN